LDKPESHRLDYTPLAGRTTGIEISSIPRDLIIVISSHMDLRTLIRAKTRERKSYKTV